MGPSAPTVSEATLPRSGPPGDSAARPGRGTVRLHRTSGRSEGTFLRRLWGRLLPCPTSSRVAVTAHVWPPESYSLSCPVTCPCGWGLERVTPPAFLKPDPPMCLWRSGRRAWGSCACPHGCDVGVCECVCEGSGAGVRAQWQVPLLTPQAPGGRMPALWVPGRRVTI